MCCLVGNGFTKYYKKEQKEYLDFRYSLFLQRRSTWGQGHIYITVVHLHSQM